MITRIKFEIELLKIKAANFFNETIPFFIARKLPRKLVHYAIIRAWAYSSVKTYPTLAPDEITWSMVLKDSKRF